MTRILDAYEYLTEVWEGVADDSFAMKAVLRSLPPSYKEIRDFYIPQVDRLSFNEFLRKLMMFKVEPIAGEIIDSAGIFDILIINVFRTCLQFYVLDTYSVL